MSVLVSGDTNIGMKRSTNQDSILLAPKNKFYAVADGMGGHNGGDIASQMSVELLPKFIDTKKDILAPVELINQAIRHVNRKIYARSLENSELAGMGTTISALMFDKNLAHVANVGDSRVYLFNNHKIYQLTRDHSLVQERLNIGFYDREGARQDPQKNVLVRTIGYESEVEVDIYQYKIHQNDLFLICSDGLHGKVADQDIVHIINSHLPDVSKATQADLDKIVAMLIEQANLNGGQDNISVIIALAK